MGAVFQSQSIDRTDRSEIRRMFEYLQRLDIEENGTSYTGGFGMADGLEFPSEKFESANEARTYLVNNCEKWGPALAVRYTYKGKDCTMIGAWCSS